jgi:glutathione-specific gamma-glutamylcyclotransferase
MKRRQTHLTPDLVARVPPLPEGTPIAPAPEGIRRPTDADFEEIVSEILSGASSPEEVWVFAYGSLIWNPGFDFEEQRIALASGSHWQMVGTARSVWVGICGFAGARIDRG